ncbi:hypothetical protein [Moritella yayanosii]|uniref:Transposase n=1 Tax=Moritella yayanosii TaxID=69539 RepID=A0A330LRK2_9GAMM|nr:protein of unknown function [Moritella yayanosii]
MENKLEKDVKRKPHHLGLILGMCKDIGIAKFIDDDALGRCLDQLYETGVSELFQGLSARTISHLKLPCEGLSLDSTSINVDGEYKDEDGNAALYVAETIQSLDEQGQLFISRAPQKLKLVKDAISEQDNYHFTELGNGYSATWIDSNYGDVKQRWLLVFSEQRFSCHADAMKMLGIWMKSPASMSISDILA